MISISKWSSLPFGPAYRLTPTDETCHMVKRVQDEIPYCSPGTSSGEQKKARSVSQPQFRRENTISTIDADQILLAPQQLASSSNSAKLNKNTNRFSQLFKSFATTIPTLDGKPKKFELVEDLCQKKFKKSQSTHRRKQNEIFSLPQAG